MATVLQINVAGIPLDLALKEEERFYLTKQIHDLNNLETRNGDFSKGITLPLTPRNKEILGNHIPTNDRFDPNPVSSIPAEVLIKGVPVFQDAFLLIGSQNPDKQLLKITVVGGTSKFFNQLSFDSIALLDFSELDLNWDLASVAAITTTTTGIVYLNSSWYTNKSRRLYEEQGGDDVTNRLDKMELGESGFWIYFHTILNKIFSNLSNLTVDTSKLDLLYNESCLAVPVPIVHDSFESIEGNITKVDTILNFVEGSNFVLDENGSGLFWQARTIFNNVVTGVAWNPIEFRFDITEAGLYNIYCNIKGLSYWPELSVNIQTSPNGVAPWTGIAGFTVFGGSQTVPVDASFNLATSADVGIGFSIRAIYTVLSDPITGDLLVFVPDSNETSMSIEKQGAGRGRFVSVSQLLPEISQRNFVKEVFKLFNIIPTEVNGNIVLSYFQEIASNEPKQIGFNKELDLDVEGVLASYGQNNIIKYEDNQAVERKDANSSFTVNSATLAKELIKIESLFSATDVSAVKNVLFPLQLSVPNYTLDWQSITDNKITVQAANPGYTTAERNNITSGDFIDVLGQRRRVLSVITDFTGTTDRDFPAQQNDQDWQHWTYSKEDVKLHIGRVASLPVESIEVVDGGFIQTYPTTRAVQFTGLLWSELTPVYYKLLFDSVFKPFIVRGWSVIGVIKFLDLTGLNPIFIEELDAYFYMNKLEQWKATGECRIEFIELKL